MTKKFQPDFWGSADTIRMLKAMLVHHRIPEDVTEKDLLTLAEMAMGHGSVWKPVSAIALGPGQDAGQYNPMRLIVYYGPDRRVTDVSMG